MSSETRRLRTVAYLRVSSDEQRERQTILTQRAAIERWSVQTGTPILAWFEDDGVSGTVPLAERPDGARLLAATRDGLDGRPIDQVVVYRLDRLGRDTIDVLRVVRDLGAAGVAVASVTEPLDASNPGGQFVLTVLAGAATFERQSILQRSMDGMRRLAREGAWLGGIVPYGYRVTGTGRSARLALSEAIVPGADLSEADVVRLIYHRMADEGRACSEIADELNARGIPPAYVRDGRLAITEAGSGGKRTRVVAGLWSPGRVRNMLISTTYRGLHRYGRRRKPRPYGEATIIERTVPAIVDDETWHRAQRRLAAARIMPRNDTSKGLWLLRGILRCTHCGLAYVGVYAAGAGGQPKRYYRCSGKHRRREYGKTLARCTAKDIKAEAVEAKVWADIHRFISDPGALIDELAAVIAADDAATASVDDELASLRRRLGEKDGERDLVISLFRRRHLAADALDRQLDQIEREEADLKRRADELEGRVRAARDGAAMLATVRTLLERLGAELEADPPWERKRQYVELLVDRIVVETIEDDRGRRSAVARPRYRVNPVTPGDTGTRAVDGYGLVEREHALPGGRWPAR